MLEDIKFDLQTLDYRALNEADWSELKSRLERDTRPDRRRTMLALVDEACAPILRWIGRLCSALGRKWQTDVVAHRRRMAAVQLDSPGNRRRSDIDFRRCEAFSGVYRHDPDGFR
jgi:hypothetical protein